MWARHARALLTPASAMAAGERPGPPFPLHASHTLAGLPTDPGPPTVPSSAEPLPPWLQSWWVSWVPQTKTQNKPCWQVPQGTAGKWCLWAKTLRPAKAKRCKVNVFPIFKWGMAKTLRSIRHGKTTKFSKKAAEWHGTGKFWESRPLKFSSQGKKFVTLRCQMVARLTGGWFHNMHK